MLATLHTIVYILCYMKAQQVLDCVHVSVLLGDETRPCTATLQAVVVAQYTINLHNVHALERQRRA